ncbi:MAG: chloride channel protein, partial [Gammaproteobacteria bacterium]|nr:chloride channel protein [Gammaproteobacteria bacterium]
RTLVACGTAAGIAASFNTPLAGVFFALEVVMMEYSVASFMPVILAAVSATALSHGLFGDVAAFQIPPLNLQVLAELPWIIGLGLLVGTVAALFNRLVQGVAGRARSLPMTARMLLAGVLMGLAGMLMPEVMGIGYDSVDAILLGQFGLMALLGLLVLKLLATSACIGLGVPGGVIGPVLFLGACVGGLGGLLLSRFFGIETDPGFYALLGMGAMMGASLQAPLAALTAMLELTQAQGVILPGMLAIVVASLTASQLFKQESLFLGMLKANGLDYAASPVMQALRRSGVASAMNSRFVRVEQQLGAPAARLLLESQPEWLLVEQQGSPGFILPAVDLARHLAEQTDAELMEAEGADAGIDLASIPARREQLVGVDVNASLQEAWELLQDSGVDALYVKRNLANGGQRVYGVLTRERIKSAYRSP